MRRRAIVLLNPAARSSRPLLSGSGSPSPRLERLLTTLRAGGFDCELLMTNAPGHAAELARHAGTQGGLEAVFAIGGDGMLRETAIGLLGGDLPLAPLPAGTANVLSRVLGIPRDAHRAAELYAEATAAETRRLDVGLVAPVRDRSGSPPSAADGTPFLMMASRGLDARALERLPLSWKRRFGRAGVALSGLRELLRGADPPFPYQVDGGDVRRAAFLSASNIPLYGGSFVLAEGAAPDDHVLDVVALERHGRAALLGFAAKVLLGRSARPVRATEVSLPGSGSVVLQVDGDAVVVRLPAWIGLAAETLPVWLPRRAGWSRE
ncbi:MAG TPA: diacylglycerol kinase family protein [Thermoanaerobaculia bacterium]|nr:diacylglycerol kinase family protein [Thermoanaerobaculia bacterium]